MASVKVKFRPAATDGRKGCVYYQVIHARKIRYISSGFQILPEQWNERMADVADPAMSQRIRLDMKRLAAIISLLDSEGPAYDADTIVERYARYCEETRLITFMSGVIDHLARQGRTRTAETYRSALISFRRFEPREDFMLDELTPSLLTEYQSHLKARGLSLNTISFYMRILRAAFNRAAESGMIVGGQPFRHVFTGMERTAKRALPLKTIGRIKALDLTTRPALDYARDMFMLSFLLRGMSFIDMAFLRKSDLKGSHIAYRRRKTGQQLTVKWTAEMQQIVDRYPPSASGFLLPIIRNGRGNLRAEYRNRSYCINHNLHRIGQMLGLEAPLTLYVARHSWASAARSNGIPIGIISEGMGHNSESTTRIYLASLETTAVDRANSVVHAALRRAVQGRSDGLLGSTALSHR